MERGNGNETQDPSGDSFPRWRDPRPPARIRDGWGGETISERPEEVGNSNRPQGNESPERYSISFRLYLSDHKERGRVTGWRETLSGGIVSSLSVPPLYGGEFPSGSGGYR